MWNPCASVGGCGWCRLERRRNRKMYAEKWGVNAGRKGEENRSRRPRLPDVTGMQGSRPDTGLPSIHAGPGGLAARCQESFGRTERAASGRGGDGYLHRLEEVDPTMSGTD